MQTTKDMTLRMWEEASDSITMVNQQLIDKALFQPNVYTHYND